MYFARLFIFFLLINFSSTLFCQKTSSKNGNKISTQNTYGQSENNYIISDFIRIDPNPFEDFIQIVMLESGSGSVEINILSIVGKVVRNYTFPSNERYILNLSDLEKGIYLLKINNGKSACVKRIFHQ
jgi:hypothetical protein